MVATTNTLKAKTRYAYHLIERYKERNITASGLSADYSKLFNKISKVALTIASCIISREEINLSDNYRKNIIKVLSKVSNF